MWYIVKAESIHWCGYSETWKVWLENKNLFDETPYLHFMSDWIGEPEEDDEDWQDDPDEYAAASVEIEEWCKDEHGSIEIYEEI